MQTASLIVGRKGPFTFSQPLFHYLIKYSCFLTYGHTRRLRGCRPAYRRCVRVPTLWARTWIMCKWGTCKRSGRC